jgi:hypothetical protein
MEMQLLPFIYPGDVVTYGNSPTLYKVTRVKQVKLLAEDEAGKSWELRIAGCKKVEDPSVFVSRKPVIKAPDLALGLAVRFRDPSRRDQYGLFVVIGQTAAGFKVSRLGGGDGMRYWHSLPAERLVPEDAVNDLYR